MSQLCSVEVPPHRLLALGDSITDGDTWTSIIRQAIHDAGQPHVTVINAGIGGNTTQQMLERLPVLLTQFQPDHVALMGGTNDACLGVEPAVWFATVERIVATCRNAGVPITVAIPCLITSQGADPAQRAVIIARRDRYAALLANLDVPRADVGGQLSTAATHAEIMAGDGIHPNYHGQAAIARAWLDALGWAKVPLPQTFSPQPYPGLITNWHITAAPLGPDSKVRPPLAAELLPDATWTALTVPLPPTSASPTDWLEQCRRSGFMTSGGPTILASCELPGGAPRWLSFGGSITSVWLDGAMLPRHTEWIGHHLGAQRTRIELTPGVHRLTVLGSGFIVSLNERMDWEENW